MNTISHWDLRRLVMAAVCVSLLVLAVSPLATKKGPARASKTWNVSMYGDDMTLEYEFVPATLTINVGDGVNWTCAVGTHTATSLPNQAEFWDSGPLTPDQSFVFTFTVPGTYNYTSLLDTDMNGTIVVQQPTPEFPGYAIAAAVGLSALLGLLVERKLKG
jgi:plastocyanin